MNTKPVVMGLDGLIIVFFLNNTDVVIGCVKLLARWCQLRDRTKILQEFQLNQDQYCMNASNSFLIECK